MDFTKISADDMFCSLSQMLRQNGGCHVVVAAPEGLKMDLAKKLGAGDVRILANPFLCHPLTEHAGIHLPISFQPRGSVREDQVREPLRLRYRC